MKRIPSKPPFSPSSPLTLYYYQDPGHGWIAIKRKLVPLEVQEKISAYSYQRGGTIYCEEDGDADKLLTFLYEKYGKESVKITSKHSRGHSPIRSYKSFQAKNTAEIPQRTVKPIQYHAAPYGFIAEIPANTAVYPALNLPADFNKEPRFWTKNWRGMNEKAASWLRNYGFLLTEKEVRGDERKEN